MNAHGSGTEPADREAVLARVRGALGPDQAKAKDLPRRYRSRSDRDKSGVRLRFVERCRGYGARCTFAAADAVSEAIAASLRARGAGRVVIPADLPFAWRPPGVTCLEDSAELAADLEAIDAAVSGCAVAIAETGTVVLDGGAGQGRRALTLVPDFHLCVVRADQLVDLVPEAIERLAPAARAGQPLTLVSGCSATSDIELERVSGVHGPRTLEVLLLD
ncbi:MAG: lactate utilization protein C [Solirubrobacterales bacterium]